MNNWFVCSKMSSGALMDLKKASGLLPKRKKDIKTISPNFASPFKNSTRDLLEKRRLSPEIGEIRSIFGLRDLKVMDHWV